MLIHNRRGSFGTHSDSGITIPMCYSAQVEQELKTIRNAMKARVDVASFERLFKRRLVDDRIKIPKAMEANFYQPKNSDEERIHALITEYNAKRSSKLEAEMFKQRARLVAAEKTLITKTTKKALSDQRIAGNKVKWCSDKIRDIKRTDIKISDARIYPFYYASVVIEEGGERLIRPMRYHCRPNGKPESYDVDYDGLYNARRDNLEGFWKNQFGNTHAIVLMTGFYENVARHDFEHRELAPGEKEENLIIHFNPKPAFQMRVACLWSHWEEKGKEDLDSFAAITDEPPPEVSAAGHDRCIIPIKESFIDQWLNPRRKLNSNSYAALDDREIPKYEHRLAA